MGDDQKVHWNRPPETAEEVASRQRAETFARLRDEMREPGPGHIMVSPPTIQVIPPVLMCHVCLDLVDIGVLTEAEARPATSVQPRSGGLCLFHRRRAAGGEMKVDDAMREELRKSLYEEGFLVEPQVGEVPLDSPVRWKQTFPSTTGDPG